MAAFVTIDEDKIDEEIKNEIKHKLNNINTSKIFYNFEDVLKIASMSEGYFNSRIMYDPQFIDCRKKIGRKWLFDVEKTRNYLREWLEEQESDE